MTTMIRRRLPFARLAVAEDYDPKTMPPRQRWRVIKRALILDGALIALACAALLFAAL